MLSPSMPSTPQHGSAASAPSPVHNAVSPFELTPRSKVKAMLAALNDDSDKENPPQSHAAATLTKSIGIAAEPPITRQLNVQSEGTTCSRGEEDDEATILASKPRGRMAARMLDVTKVTETDVGMDDSNGKGTAYQRIRRQLMDSKKAEAINDDGPDLPKAAPEIKSGGSEDTSITATTPRRRRLAKSRTTLNSSRKSSIPRSREASVRLFVSPGPPTRASSAGSRSPPAANGSDSDLPSAPQQNASFLALVERKRKERVEREETAAQRKVEKDAELKRFAKERGTTSETDSDDGNTAGHKFTQQARPSRKASKKALNEMHRETQRMSRNMQLAHEARTRKKITKESLFAKFNFRPGGLEARLADRGESNCASTSSDPVSDVEGMQGNDTPPTSPAVHEEMRDLESDKESQDLIRNSKIDVQDPVEEGFSSIEDVKIEPIPKLDKGKGKALEEKTPDESTMLYMRQRTKFTPPPIRVHPQKRTPPIHKSTRDSDSDLEIIPMIKPSRLAVFDRLPVTKARKASSLHTLKALANLDSPGKKISKTRTLMTSTELQYCLQRRARQQAAQERAEKLQDLRDRGVIVQTVEERERDQMVVEDLLDKARKEAEGIMKKEKAAAKKDRKENGRDDGLEDTSGEDDDWKQELEKSEVSRSDYESDNEEEEEDDEDDDHDDEDENDEGCGNEDEETLGANQETDTAAAFFDQEAEDDKDGDENEANEDTEEAELESHNEEAIQPLQSRRSYRKSHMIIDEDEDDETQQPAVEPAQTPTESVTTEKLSIPGLPAFDHDSLGLTQMFASTLANNRTQPIEFCEAKPGLYTDGVTTLGLSQMFAGTVGSSQPHPVKGNAALQDIDTEHDSLAFLRHLPAPSLPEYDPAIVEDSQDIIRDSQVERSQVQNPDASSTTELDLHYSQSQIQYDSLSDTQRMNLATQISEFPDPTQDLGFENVSPILNRFVQPPQSTVDTVILPTSAVAESPIAKKKGRLRRRNDVLPMLSGVEEDLVPTEAASDDDEDGFEISANAFDVMRKASWKRLPVVDTFDKKKSDAKDMVEEQAQESEDEYAGLGGASDDDSLAEDDEDVAKMIDDDKNLRIDERGLAAFYADKERANDEKQVEKLFKDITHGMLRKKRGADYDLSDSDDDGEARRRMKRREFAKMRKALLEDENISKIATNPKKLAFLRVIEDREKDDDLDFLDQPEDSSQIIPDSQEATTTHLIQAPTAHAKRKRSISDDLSSNDMNRPPPHLRRTTAGKTKESSTLAEIRQSLSFLVEEPNAIPHLQHSDSSSDNDDDKKNETIIHDENTNTNITTPTDPFATRRRTNPIIDRISLKRAETAASTNRNARLAFHDPSSISAMLPGFRVPSLLRRATTQLTDSSTSSSSSNIASGIGLGSGRDGTVGTERMAGVAAGASETAVLIKRGGTKKSSINYYAREKERMERTGMGESERRRGEERRRNAGQRRGMLGVLGVGSFD
ncbi:MAG: hypothetical protein M1827_004212 [Pycnora praestabilis]|nr:MAG: hypothetical protein M1827_004212 [Pycnora praestabilis]